MSLLGLLSEKDINKETYLGTSDICRQDLERQFSPSEATLTKLIKEDKDTSLTYCGMVKFLQSEMETSPALVGQGTAAKIRVYKKTAKKMMQRSEAFTLAIRTLKPHHVRLSMHPSSGAAKLSIALIPTQDGNFQKSPWHSCVALGQDGAYRCVHSEDVRDTHELVYEHGRPYFFREREVVEVENKVSE
jgi:pyoverdine/dityrosine biosynthesis protein Dit1